MAIDGILVEPRGLNERFVGSSIQFRIPDQDAAGMRRFIESNATQGVVIKWFGDSNPKGYTSRYDSWRYLGEQPMLPNTMAILATTCDIRIPLTFVADDCLLIGEIIEENYKQLIN